jgi:hypothetical protein
MISKISDELRRDLQEAGGKPLRLRDDETKCEYVVIPADVFDRQAQPAPNPLPPLDDIPEGIRRSRAALRRDLPELLAKRRNRGKWVCYHLETQVGISNDFASLRRLLADKSVPREEYTIEQIGPGAGSKEEEEIDIFDVRSIARLR